MNPYEVLGIDKRATDEQIKEAYRELVKKYHPDKYQDNPLADLAEEKLREINEAYEMLMKPTSHTGSSYTGSSSAYGAYNSSTYGSSQRGTNGSQYGNTYYGGTTYGTGYEGTYSGTGSGDYYDIRSALDRNDIQAARQLLASRNNRTAEWYFLSGVMNYKSGYYDAALQYMRQAMHMDPSNMEYQDVYRRVSGSGAIYRASSTSRGYSGSDCADLALCYCCGSQLCCR